MAKDMEWWAEAQSDEELMQEGLKKSLEKKRSGLRHEFKDTIDRMTQGGDSKTPEEKHRLFRQTFKQMGYTAADAWRNLYSQEFAKAMGIKGASEKVTGTRDIYTDPKTGAVGNIRTSKDKDFIKRIAKATKKQRDNLNGKIDIMQKTWDRLQEGQPKQEALFGEETGTDGR